MEERNANVIFGKAGGNASKNSYTCKLSIPKTWVDRMGVRPDSREVTLCFDGDTLTVRRPDMANIKRAPLANKQKIRRFALVWQQMYLNHKTTPFFFFEDTSFVGDGMADLGFEMDCGKSLEEAFPGTRAFQDNAALERIIKQIDLQTLGNAIFSQWRYWNHWSMSPMKEENFQWFVIAFSRLAELTK